MDWMTIFERFGPLGIAVLYFVRKEVQWEAEKKLVQDKYEAILKDATKLGAELLAKMDGITENMQKCKREAES